jgi:Lrp/AsnC ligand binding domain
VLEAHTITGSGDVHCRIAASSHDGLQQALVDLNRSKVVVRSTSVIALTEVVRWRTMPLLASAADPRAGRSSMTPNTPSS